MNLIHQQILDLELHLARTRMNQRDFETAMEHLERAHVLGQENFVSHLVSHWLMFRVEVQRFSLKAAGGQLIRLTLGMVGNVLGRLPIGNIGSSRVSMFAPMEIPHELQTIMRAHGLVRGENDRASQRKDRDAEPAPPATVNPAGARAKAMLRA